MSDIEISMEQYKNNIAVNPQPIIIEITGLKSYSESYIDSLINNKIDKHNLDENSHTFLLNKIDDNYNYINNKIDSEISSVTTSVNDLIPKVDINTQNIDNLLSAQAGITGDILNLKNNYTTLDTKVDTFDNRITENSNNIEELKSSSELDKQELLNKIQINTDNISSLDKEVNDNFTILDSNININAENIVQLNNKVDNNYTELKSKTEQNSLNINSLTQTVQNNYNTLKPKIDKNTGDIISNTELISQNTLQINTNTYNISNNTKLINDTINNLKLYSKTSDFATVAFTGEYSDIKNTPAIPSVEGFATQEYVNNKIDSAIGSVVGIKFVLLDELPQVGENGTIYLIPHNQSQGNIYDEFIWLDLQQKFEKIGSSEVDLSGYYKKQEVNNLLDTKVDKVEGKSLISDLEIERLSSITNYDDTEIKNLINTKQNKLVQGANIVIDGDTISAIDTKYSAGNNISIDENNQINCTLSTLEWGNIEGDINNQNDLISKLNKKQNILTQENAGTGINIVDGIISSTQSLPSWGDIQGDITQQIDLSQSLNNKINVGSLSINNIPLEGNKTSQELGLQPAGNYITTESLPNTITIQGNTFNGPSQLVQVDNDGKLPALDGSKLINVRGEKGDTGTIEIGTVTTGEAGSEVIINNIGTPSTAILDITIPRGDKGDKGDTGEKGVNGASGGMTAVYEENTYTLNLNGQGGEAPLPINMDYNESFNKPQINSVELTGDKTSSDLNLVDINLSNLSEEGLKVIEKNSGSGLEICDIGTALYIDETKGLRRWLNGQIVTINEQTQAFLDKLKQIKSTSPSLFITEEEWQAEKEASDHGQVGKFVLNETAGTLRLPAVINIQGVFDLQNAGLTVEAGLPNIKSENIGLVRSGSSIDGGGAIKVTSKGRYAEGASVNQSWSGTFALNAADSSSYYKDGATVQPEAIQYPYYIQIATGQETEVNIRNDIESIVPYTLFDSKYSEAKQYNASWVLGGSTLSKSVYPTAYEAALVEYNSEVADGTTVELPSGGSYTKRGVSGGVTVKLSTDETMTEYDWKLDTVAEILTVPTLNGSEDLLSDRYDDLELKASGSTYTAPANGWFWIQKLSSSTGQYLTPVIKDSNGNIKYTLTSQPTAAGYDAEILAPVSKGDVISIGYSVDGATKSFRFIYAKSNGSLYFFVASVAQNAPLANLGRIEEQLAQRKVVVETYKNGNSWYRVWSDGWCEQGGVFDRGSDITTGGSVVISLVHPFKDTHYTLMVNNGGNSTGNGFAWHVASNIMTARALSEFCVCTWKGETSNRYISWYACGY